MLVEDLSLDVVEQPLRFIVEKGYIVFQLVHRARRAFLYTSLAASLFLIPACSLRSNSSIPQSSELPVQTEMAEVSSPAPTPTVDASSELEMEEPSPSPVETPAPTAAAKGVVIKRGNVRNKPTANGSTILGQVDAGISVNLRLHNPGRTWYVVEAPDGLVGWMSAVLLQIDPVVVEQVPEGTEDPAIRH